MIYSIQREHVYDDEQGQYKFRFRAADLRHLIQEVCTSLGLYSLVAEELLMMTAAHESHMGEWMRQIHGPARGVFQMEPATALDLYANSLWYKPHLEKLVDRHRPLIAGQTIPMSITDSLVHSTVYATALARAHYARFKDVLPVTIEFDVLYSYYKLRWNTPKGKATKAAVKKDYEHYVVGK